MRIVFLGTPAFARTILAGLLDHGIEVPLVVTQPDRIVQQRGRGKEPEPSAVARYAHEKGLTVRSPEKLTEVSQELRAAKPDAFVVASFGQIIPSDLLKPKPPWVNVHASLLPKYRGASPISQAILDGEAQTGISLMAVTDGLDEGPVYATTEVPISDQDTTETLTEKLAAVSVPALLESISSIIDGSLQADPQEEADASYAEKLTKISGRIDWEKGANYLDRFVRAMQPWPGAWTEAEGQRVVFLEVSAADDLDAPPGTFDGPPLRVVTGDGTLAITKLKPAGKAAMDGDDWLRGYRGDRRFV